MRTVLVLLTFLASQSVNGLTIDPDKAGIKTVGGLPCKREMAVMHRIKHTAENSDWF